MLHEQKTALRKTIEEQRELLSAEEIATSNRQILHHLLHLPQYRDAKVIFFFVGTAHEVDTTPMILDALASGKRVCVPRCISKGIMNAYEIKGLEDLQDGKYGIMEPRDGCVYVEPADIDLAVVPCVTCDTGGHRLGYGGGFYDRYLEGQSFTTAILCRSALLSHTIPTEHHDQIMDIVITDQSVYHCKENTNHEVH